MLHNLGYIDYDLLTVAKETIDHNPSSDQPLCDLIGGLSADKAKRDKSADKVNLNGRIHHAVAMAVLKYRVSNHKLRDKTGLLIDHGANGGLTGLDVKVINETRQFLDVSAIDNH